MQNNPFQQFFYNNPQQAQYQRQIFQMQQSQQFQMYLQYTIDTDMQNVLGVCMDYLALQEAQPTNYELLSVFKNRMILQLNLSNTIHLDLQDNAKQLNYRDYQTIKDEAKNKFATVIQIIQNKFKKPQNSEALQMLQNHLNNNLVKETRQKQQELEQNGVQYQFGEKVVQQLISAMQYQDQQYTNLQQQKSYKSISQQELYNKAESRYYQAKEKIKNSGVQQRQLTPELYPENVKKLLGSYFLANTAPSQYRNQFENDFKQQLLTLRQQKSGLSISCLIDFSSKLNNKQMQYEINRWVNYITDENCVQRIEFQFNIQLDKNDQSLFGQFTSQSSELVQDYGQKRNIVDIVKKVLKYALSIIRGKMEENPLLNLDLNEKDQIAQQFLKLKDQFRSSFMKRFCQDVGNMKTYDYQYRYEEGIDVDIALLQRLTN